MVSIFFSAVLMETPWTESGIADMVGVELRAATGIPKYLK
jgi:hypothetical protein